MSAYQLKIAKYYRLSDKKSIETENVAVLVDTKNRRLSVSCCRIQKENVAILSEPKAFPKIIFRDNHLYVLFSGSSSDGFRLTFGKKEREGFVKLMHSMGVLMDVSAEVQGGDSQFSMSQESQGMESQGHPQQQYRPSSSISTHHHHRPPAFTQQPTPQVSLYPPNVRRDTTDVFNPHQSRHSFSQPPPSDSPSFRHHPYYGAGYEMNSGRSQSSRYQNPTSYSQRAVSVHEHGEAVKPVKIFGENQKLDKAIQTDDLIDVLMEDETFVKNTLQTIMKNGKFLAVVKAMRSRLESMDTVVRERIHWKTNPNFNSQGMPPPVIHLPNSDAE